MEKERLLQERCVLREEGYLYKRQRLLVVWMGDGVPKRRRGNKKKKRSASPGIIVVPRSPCPG